MSTTAPSPQTTTATVDAPSTPPLAIALSLVLLGLVVIKLPLFVCMPLTDDAVLYDLQATYLLNGGILYRDVLEPNLPGIVWLHVLFRSLFGFSSEAIRLVDIGIFGSIVSLLALWIRRSGRSTATAIGASLLTCWFYLGLSEWCHVQRDTWILLPALGALTLRYQQVELLAAAETTPKTLFRRGMIEGLLWAAAFWIKPHITLPALFCLIVSAAWASSWRRVAIDWSGILSGGLLAGIVGVSWMWGSGAWPFFLETFLNWNPGYVAAGKEHWTAIRFLGMLYRMFPWILLHLVAVPVAAWRLLPILGRMCRQQSPAIPTTAELGQSLLAAFYLGSVTHAFLLQHLFDYIHAPIVCLAIATLATCLPPLTESRGRRLALTAFLFLVAIISPPFSTARLSCWPRCFVEGSSPALRDQLKHSSLYDFQSMDKVREYLSQQNLGRGELFCMSNGLISLYSSLNTQPDTRYVYMESLAAYFPKRHDLFLESLNESNQRFVVTNLIAAGMRTEDAYDEGDAGPNAVPPTYPRQLRGLYPWSHQVVYRAGPYLVHRIQRPLGRLSTRIPHKRHEHTPQEFTSNDPAKKERGDTAGPG